MSDGELSQDEIDALLAGSGVVYSDLDIAKRLYDFANFVCGLDDLVLQNVLRKLDSFTVVTALYRVDRIAYVKVLKNLSKNAQKDLNSDLECVPNLRINCVLDAQETFMDACEA